MNMNARDKLIVALDVESAARALDLFHALRDVVGMFKIGSQLFTAAGPDVVRQIIAGGGRVFLDLKFHDIPNTVAAAGVEATRLGVSIFNVHASGGSEMMQRTAGAVAEIANREGLAKPKVIAVTLLTSMDQDSQEQIGISDEPGAMVARLARAAAD
jgi:orotidine-5'-phosphate decarboxylase